MAFFFNIENLEKAAVEEPRRFIELLKRHYYKRLQKPSDKVNLVGTSFIINPEPLFMPSNIDVYYIVQYIRLAARRDYTMYKQYKITSLPLSYFPDIDLDNIKHNPLLKITEDNIFFKYENKE